jgi:hypothetical protein
MTFTQLISSINTLLTRVGSNRVSGSDVLTAVLNVANFFATQIVDYLPSWSAELTFQTDGSDSGKYCIYADTNGKKRIFETLEDDNLNHLPPSNPSITENTYWKEVSASAAAAIPEWGAGVYGPGLVIVFHNHSTEGQGLYILLNPTRPFASADIEDEIEDGDWLRISNVKKLRGAWADGANLPTDADKVGTGVSGELEPGDEWYTTVPATYDSGLGDGPQDWNSGALIKYLAPGKFKVTQ